MASRLASISSHVALGISVTLAVATLGGCSPNRGDQLAGQFAAWMQGDSRIADVSASGNNALPFLGSVDATISLGEGTNAADGIDVLQHARDFKGSNEVYVTIALESDSFDGQVALSSGTHADADGARIRMLYDVAGWGTIPFFSLDARAGAYGGGDSLTATTNDDVFAALDRLTGAATDVTVGAYEIRDVLGTGSLKLDDADEATAPRALRDTIGASYTIIAFAYASGGFSVRVAGEPTDDVAALASAVAPGLTFSAEFGITTRDGDTSSLEPAISAVLATNRATAVYASDHRINVSTATASDALAIDAVLQPLDLGAAQVAYLIRTRTAASQSARNPFSLYTCTPGVTLPRFQRLFDAVEGGSLGNTNFEYYLKDSDARITADLPTLTDEQMRDFAGGLREALPNGTSVSISRNSWMSFTAADHLDLGDVELGAQAQQQAAVEKFIAAWNDAR